MLRSRPRCSASSPLLFGLLLAFVVVIELMREGKESDAAWGAMDDGLFKAMQAVTPKGLVARS